MPACVFVDSSAWIAFFRASDGRHGEADRLLRLAIARRVPLLTTTLVLAEVHRFFLFHVGSRAALHVLDRIDESPAVEVACPTEGDHREARRWLVKLADQRLSYTDAVSFTVMRSRRCHAALTFDRDFATAGFRSWAPRP